WIFGQCRGIVEAVSVIHAPLSHLQEGEKLYGRHGDIKPENVLWFKRGDEEKLVLTDMGLAEQHRETSRSNQDGASVQTFPGYRPPECVIEDGVVSRSLDIWSLGALFLDLIIWALDGSQGIEDFRLKRFASCLEQSQSTVYFY